MEPTKGSRLEGNGPNQNPFSSDSMTTWMRGVAFARLWQHPRNRLDQAVSEYSLRVVSARLAVVTVYLWYIICWGLGRRPPHYHRPRPRPVDFMTAGLGFASDWAGVGAKRVSFLILLPKAFQCFCLFPEHHPEFERNLGHKRLNKPASFGLGSPRAEGPR